MKYVLFYLAILFFSRTYFSLYCHGFISALALMKLSKR